MAKKTTLSHAAIGELIGTQSDSGINRFLGLQYATLKDHFASPEIKHYQGAENVDCTKPGPQPPCFAPGPEAEFAFIQHKLDYDRSLVKVSDRECLNLNITAPSTLKKDQKLPVLVFIHGGGFSVGSPSVPQYDMTRLVELSAESDMAIIAVSIGYRLSAPGFLTSKELREAGYKPNNGLGDQRTALQWIQKHISGFGGDPSNVTLMGQSAGAVSVTYHLHASERLFTRFILMSGSYLSQPPASLASAEENYTKALQALNLASTPPKERIPALLTMDPLALCTTCFHAGVQDSAVLDDDLIPPTLTFSSLADGSLALPALAWCQSALIGDCQFDGNIRSLALTSRKNDIAKDFCESIKSSLPSSAAWKLLQAYDLHPTTTPDEEKALHAILEICTDIYFLRTHSLPRAAAWEGSWKGEAGHIQDLMWVLMNLEEVLGEEQREQGMGFARRVVGFVNGKEEGKGWERWPEALVVGPEGRVEVKRDEAPGNGRRGVVLELAREVGMDRLREALGAFMAGG
ncbi:hypothetical protein M409DRAFT_63148 [Zasmidium cellare ATCC 36951]|uniref:Carboxylic ester hydrolase n=1 Tax=Zasmidium cellare ATCC 36951 TaxID=1080233 RepID=A0A6A6CZM2_ZASCE|nr:uncharacterized protein M409DRAFT_63148 [Zasmidium cellare ATCC 36951]KAF2172475.1 hypothetical protein M409DRAFT_63148 [Zasmidium cellare ATCC 36951]